MQNKPVSDRIFFAACTRQDEIEKGQISQDAEARGRELFPHLQNTHLFRPQRYLEPLFAAPQTFRFVFYIIWKQVEPEHTFLTH